MPIDVKLDAWPRPVSSYAALGRERPLLLVGVGLSGYRVLEEVARHIDNTLLDQHSEVINLIYVDVLERSSESIRPRYLPQSSSLITEYILRGVEEDRNKYIPRSDQSQWDWWFNLNAHNNTGRKLRHSARAILMDHVESEVTQSTLLVDLNRKWLQDNMDVILVGSVLEYTGVNIMPDLAAIIRTIASERHYRLLTHVLALLDEQSARSAAFENSDRDVIRTAALFELAFYQSSSASRVTVHPNYSYAGPPSLLSTVTCVPGGEGAGVHAAATFCWALGLSQVLSDKLQEIAGSVEHRPTMLGVNFLVGDGEFMPMQERRRWWFYKIKLHTIHRDYAQNMRREPERHSSSDLSLVLKDVHYDLYTPVAYINAYSLSSVAGQIKRLQTWLRDTAKLTNTKLEEQSALLKCYSDGPFQIASELNIAPTIPRSLGWEFTPQNGLMLRVGQDGPRESLYDDEPFAEYEELLDRFAVAYGETMLHTEMKRLQTMFASLTGSRRFVDYWSRKFISWSDMLMEYAQGYGMTTFRIGMGLPPLDGANTLVLEDGYDRTGYAYFMLSGRVPVGTLSFVADTTSVDIRTIMDDLIREPLYRSVDHLFPHQQDVFKLPPVFLALLSDCDLFTSVFWAWYNEQLPQLFGLPHTKPVFVLPNEIETYDNLSWRERFQIVLRGATDEGHRLDLRRASFAPMASAYAPHVTRNRRTASSEDDVLASYIRLTFNKMVDLVEINRAEPAEDDPMYQWYGQRRLLFEFFLCWRTGNLDELSLRGRNWMDRLESFKDLAQRDWDWVQTVKRNRPRRLRQGDYPGGDPQSELLNDIFNDWERKIARPGSTLPIVTCM